MALSPRLSRRDGRRAAEQLQKGLAASPCPGHKERPEAGGEAPPAGLAPRGRGQAGSAKVHQLTKSACTTCRHIGKIPTVTSVPLHHFQQWLHCLHCQPA